MSQPFRVVPCLASISLAVAPWAGADPGIATAPPADDARAVKCDAGWMVPYTETIPGTTVSFEMVPVPGGTVRLNVAAEGDDPAYAAVELGPFWAGVNEVTWAEYQGYMALDKAYAELQQLAGLGDAVAEALRSKPRLAGAVQRQLLSRDELGIDAVTAPTPLYDPSTTYESGDGPSLPAVTMTPFAARQYTKWLSALCGRQYRLPSEAEWLRLAAAGRDPDDATDDLDSEAWYADNAEFVAHPVREKAPNPWGLYDVLGNAGEMVLDSVRAEGRPELAGKRVGWAEGVAWPRAGDPRLAKGGWYDAEAEELTLAARMADDESEWKASDPNLPMSPWWYADYPATGVGFRVVRPLTPLQAVDLPKVWDADDSAVARAVAERLREGRGKRGPVGPELPEVLEELAAPAVRDALK